MQVDHVSLILRLTVAETVLQRQLSASALKLGEQLAHVIDKYSREHKLGYYPAISMLSKQCLDSGFWAAPEFMIISQSCPSFNPYKLKRLHCLLFGLISRQHSISW